MGEKYNALKVETIQIHAKSQLISKQLKDSQTHHEKLQNQCFELKQQIKQMEKDKYSMNVEKEELNKENNILQNKYCDLFNEHNTLVQQFQATQHELSDIKLEKQTAFIQRDLLDSKVEQLKGDKSNINEQLNRLR